jgi:O-succinylbenzoate synthase
MRYFFEDIIETPFELNPDSTLSLPSGPGLGVTVKMDTLQQVTLRKEAYRR